MTDSNVGDFDDIQACCLCSCTDDDACPGGCFWVEPDLCSACVTWVLEALKPLADGRAHEVLKALVDAAGLLVAPAGGRS